MPDARNFEEKLPARPVALQIPSADPADHPTVGGFPRDAGSERGHDQHPAPPGSQDAHQQARGCQKMIIFPSMSIENYG